MLHFSSFFLKLCTVINQILEAQLVSLWRQATPVSCLVAAGQSEDLLAKMADLLDSMEVSLTCSRHTHTEQPQWLDMVEHIMPPLDMVGLERAFLDLHHSKVRS